MRRFRLRPRTWIALGVVGVVAAALSVAGYAYFTSAGVGSSQAVVGSVANVQLAGTVPTGLWPDGSEHAIDVYYQLGSGGQQYVDAIHGTVQSQGNCDGSWFTVDDLPVYNYLQPAGSWTYVGTTHVRMNDNGQNQNDCQGLTLNINWTSGP